ncbi:hypothetical protein DH2020_039054 [Rehmannia glutinosa]|uniref:B-like cyclin n=1 Tax=Rehmannia glutinosa TaxID=99300 RepID=A0ABR0UZI1_REHGL
MASRQVVQQQKIGEAPVNGAIKPKNMAVEKKNRRALGDIGNLVTVRGGVDGKPLPQISRPVTSFAKEESHCPKANSEKAVSIKSSKPTEISTDSNEVAENEKPIIINKKNAGEKSSKKKAPTLTSTLTARSKNEGRAYNNYMDAQPEINEKMRAILIDWLVQVHHKFELSPETLYLTINIVDRYLASKTTLRKELQLVNELVCISDRTYTNEQVLKMEKRILGELEWNLTVPTPYVFLVRFIKASMTDSNLGMMNYETLIYCPSKIAASAVYAARCTLNKNPIWNETLELHTGFSEQELMDCAKLLVNFHSMAAEQKLRGIYRKYCNSERGAVALLPPAKSLLAVTKC